MNREQLQKDYEENSIELAEYLYNMKYQLDEIMTAAALVHKRKLHEFMDVADETHEAALRMSADKAVRELGF